MTFARASWCVGLVLAVSVGCLSSTPTAPAAGDPACNTPLCPNDPPFTSDQVDECNRVLAGSCGVTYRALLDCAVANKACDSAGHLDEGAVDTACASQESAYSQCTPNVPDASLGGT